MPLWGNVDASNNAPNFSGLTGYDTSTTGESLANSETTSVFSNTYMSATRTNVEFGVFGIDFIIVIISSFLLIFSNKNT